MIGRNILANILGISWSVLLSLAIVPFQVRILGVEAYGLIAFTASLQMVFAAFDFGLSPTITREVASDTSPDLHHSRNLIQDLATVYWGIGVALGLLLAANSAWLANHWFKLNNLSPGFATLAVQLGALAILLRWPVSFYSGIIAGRQRFDLLNLLLAGANTIGLLGGIVIIVVSASLTNFMVWRVATALVEVMLYRVACRHVLPGLVLWHRPSRRAINQVWRFAVSMNLIVILSLVLTHSDKFLISKLLPMGALGYYSVAYNTAYGLALVQGMITSVMFPVLAAGYGQRELETLTTRCMKATQLVSYSTVLPGLLLIFFSDDLLRIWIDPDTAQAAYQVLGILAFGFLLAAPLNICSTLAIATGYPRLLLLVNGVGLMLYLPCLFILTTRFALHGAALSWVLLQVYYLITLAPRALRILGQSGTLVWFGRNFAPFLLIGTVVFGIAKVAASLIGGSQIAVGIACSLSIPAYVVAGFLALHQDLKADSRRYSARLLIGFRRVLRS